MHDVLKQRIKHKKSATNLDLPIPYIFLKLSQFPKTFISEAEDERETEEVLSDDEPNLVESENE